MAQHPIGRRALTAGLGAALALPRPARARTRYVFDHTAGRLEFVARHLGVLSSTGRFEDFGAELLIDPDRPLTTRVDVTVRTAAVALAYPARWTCCDPPPSSTWSASPRRASRAKRRARARSRASPLAGELTIRGITRPYRMEARLVDRRRDATLGRDVAEFSGGGVMKRSEFGMVTEQAAISDEIRLAVRVRIIV